MDLIPVSTRNFIRRNRPFISDVIDIVHVCPLTWRKLFLDVVQTGLSIQQHERLYDTYTTLLLQLPIGVDGRTISKHQILSYCITLIVSTACINKRFRRSFWITRLM